jgi:hypothetical protein
MQTVESKRVAPLCPRRLRPDQALKRRTPRCAAPANSSLKYTGVSAFVFWRLTTDMEDPCGCIPTGPGKGETPASSYDDELDASPSLASIGQPVTEPAHVRGALVELEGKETDGLHSPNSEQLDSFVTRIDG